MGKSSSNLENNPLSVFFFTLFEFLKFFALFFFYFGKGLLNIEFKNKYQIVDIFLSIVAGVSLGLSDYLYTWWPILSQKSFGKYLFWVKFNIPYLYFFLPLLVLIAHKGYKAILEKKSIYNAINIIKRNKKDLYPRVISVDKLDHYKTIVKVDSPELGHNHFIKNQNDLESSFNKEIERIVRTSEPRYLEIHLTTKRLPTKVSYQVLKNYCQRPCEFLIGETQGGILTHDLRKLPHMLIAGSTGQGKSNYFKSVLTTLLKNTNHLQMHLLDLKGGIEMNDFKGLPNVNIVTTMEGALATLERVKEEMDDRFRFLAKKGSNNLVPARDKKDRILIAVDEASVLYMKRYSQNENSKIALAARKVTDEIAKLSRASAIHIILATQKVTKETIDTHIRENISGRVSFRANDMEASRTVLSNADAKNLPDIPGRGIFKSGRIQVEFQAPLITQAEIKETVKNVSDMFRMDQRRVFQQHLITNSHFVSTNNKSDLYDS